MEVGEEGRGDQGRRCAYSPALAFIDADVSGLDDAKAKNSNKVMRAVAISAHLVRARPKPVVGEERVSAELTGRGAEEEVGTRTYLLNRFDILTEGVCCERGWGGARTHACLFERFVTAIACDAVRCGAVRLGSVVLVDVDVQKRLGVAMLAEKRAENKVVDRTKEEYEEEKEEKEEGAVLVSWMEAENGNRLLQLQLNTYAPICTFWWRALKLQRNFKTSAKLVGFRRSNIARLAQFGWLMAFS